MFCPKCGKQIPENAKFCGGCGNPVKPAAGVVSGGPVNLAKQPEASNLPSGTTMTRDTRDEERKNRKLTIILSITLAVLLLVAAGMGIYYFKVLKGSEDSKPEQTERTRNPEEEEQTEGTETGDEEQTEEEQQDTEETEQGEERTEDEEEGVVSDTNEVVGNTILENIPKAAYSYTFNDTLGKARVAVRSAPDTEPEETDDMEPQYVDGIDGKAVYLDGTYGIKLSDVEAVGDSYTVAFWMRADELYDWAPFIHIGQDLQDPGARVRLWLGQKTDTTSIAPILSSERAQTNDSVEIRPGDFVPNSMQTGVWYHIAFTVDGFRQGSKPDRLLGTLYVAGTYAAEGDVVPYTMKGDGFAVYLGINRWDQLYPVAFDDVKIWDQVLNAGQIQELYDAYQ